jgi:exo-beta-1,3-glucanase (GH17 family)
MPLFTDLWGGWWERQPAVSPLLASNAATRSTQAPDIPAIAETVPGFDFSVIIGVMAAAGTPANAIQKISQEIAEVVKHPELVKQVDFIAVHLLPYHEGLPIERAVDYALERYQALSRMYPNKKIVITEIGWPSRGPTIGEAVASELNQARFVREFLARPA